ncbi:MAG: S-layer homology domain-containing protein [Oscillospiraceae bacterium]|nr:S-layer homology domain-containing protein [Oscillospiraceae bacterium]
MKTRRIRAVAALLMVMCMVVNLLGTSVFAAGGQARTSAVMENDNQSSGIILTKEAKANTDGTVDVTIEAYTTGKVTNTNSTVPTDIVLVLDVSGSMDDKQENTYKTVYNAVNGDDYIRYSNYWWRTFYGFEGSGDYYILVNGEYIPVHKEGYDSNRYDYYHSDITNKSYYPILNPSITPDRVESYEVVQFYAAGSELVAEGRVKLTVMQEAVNKFITETAAKNASINDTSKQHRLSIIKFAGDSYYTAGGTVQGNTAAQNAALSANHGDNKYNSNTYNYTQVVKGLNAINSSNVSEYTSAVSSLDAGGATAVDYGVELAQHVLYDRTAVEIANRKEVVIVFTDGEPTHGSSYSGSVAAAAVNFAAGLKNAEATVYAISMESHADATVLEAPDYEDGNKFMHYLSSNFPEATASGNTINPGTGNIDSGYYMTPSGDMSLEMIFDTIVHEIGTPTITLGANATVYDHISTYFNLETGNYINDVKTYTSARKADGTWDTPQAAALSVTSTNDDSTIMVSGFDFDENYISAEPRNTDNYGKKLIITIALTPDYNAIETHKADIKAGDGWVPTNNGNALVEDTHDNIAARVATPSVQMPKVTYMLDGKEYDYAYVMPSDEHTLISEPTKEGHSFSGWSTTDATVSAGKFTMPENDVVIRGSFAANEYKVTYKYNIATPPANWPVIPDDYNLKNGSQITHKFGETVEIKAPLSLQDYKFVGWTPSNVDLAITDNKFTMPAHDITFIAHFEPMSGIEYKVEHWLEIIDGVDDTAHNKIVGRYSHDYTAVDDTSVSGKKFGRVYTDTRTGTSGAAEEISWVEYHGFTKYENSPSLLSGTVSSDLVLKLYYTRNSHKVTYKYAPITGVAMPADPVDNTKYFYGEEVTGATAATITGYEFTGWIPSVSTVAGVLPSGGKFPMPDLDIHFDGRYVPGDNKYAIEYYQQNLNDTNYTKVDADCVYNLPAKTGDRVSAVIKHYDGFKLNPTHPLGNEDAVVAADGSTVLKVYYDRESYKVKYAWFAPQSDYVMNKYNSLLPGETTLKYGKKFSIEAKLLAENATDEDTANGITYTFNGWYSRDIELRANTPDTTKFTMPAHDVTILGGFNGTAAVKDTTVTYDEHDDITKEPKHEPSQDTTKVQDYIIVDPNGGSWTHNENGTDTQYVNPVDLLMENNRTLEGATKDNHEFVGWKNIGSAPEVLANYSALANSDKAVHVYVAQYKAIPTPPGGGGGGGITRYTLTYNSNGGTEFKSETYVSGKIVEITKVPTREGYIFDGWHTNEGLTSLVTSVKMNRDITVYAAWIKGDDEYVQDEDGITVPVPGMLNGDDHFAYVIGYPDGEVKPNASITRAEISAIFFRLLKADIREENLTTISPYADVAEGKWYTAAIATMSKLGILKGIGDEDFAPDSPITRAEFAVICARFDASEAEIKDRFTDIAGHWAEAEIHKAAANGWIKGYEDSTFRPNNQITRAEAMVLINRVLHRIPKTCDDLLPDMIKWPDNTDKSRWYYIAIQEATNSHEYKHLTEIYEKWTKLTQNTDWTVYEK